VILLPGTVPDLVNVARESACRPRLGDTMFRVNSYPQQPVDHPGLEDFYPSSKFVSSGCRFQSLSVSATSPRVPTKPRGWGEEGPTTGRAGSEATGSYSDLLPVNDLDRIDRVPVRLGEWETVPYWTFFYFVKRKSMELYLTRLNVFYLYSGT